jgi:hypothetical protein
MRRFLWKLGAAYGHARGLFALNNGRLERAETLLRHGITCGDSASSPLRGESYLLLAVAMDRRGRCDEAVELFWTGIAEVERSPHYSTDDVNYLGSYFCDLLQLADFRPRFERFDITAVRKSLRRDFAMSLSKAQLTS